MTDIRNAPDGLTDTAESNDAVGSAIAEDMYARLATPDTAECDTCNALWSDIGVDGIYRFAVERAWAGLYDSPEDLREGSRSEAILDAARIQAEATIAAARMIAEAIAGRVSVPL